jgi:glucose/arabinose dehydrogenase
MHRHPFRPTLESLEGRLTPSTLPAGFHETTLATGLNNPSAMELAPDGRIFVLEQAGNVRVVGPNGLQAAPFLSLSVDSSGERGLLGIAFDPDFLTNHFLYLYYTTNAGGFTHNRLSRFTAAGNTAVPGSERVLMELEPLGAAFHNGGAIHFGNDGKLYVGVGENTVGANAQTLSNRLGKVLRINPDGSIPADNPFVGVATGVNQAIWALGLRNPFTFAVQRETGRIFINDVGAVSFEEIDDGRAGANYGWPNAEGFSSDPRFVNPLLAYSHGTGTDHGNAITGGAFELLSGGVYPADYRGTYFHADLVNNWIRRYDPATGADVLFASNLPANPVDLKVDGVGRLYYLSHGAGVLVRIDADVTTPINPADPVAFLVRGDGTYVSDLLNGASQRISTSRATALTEGANGVLFGSFPGFGTFRYDVATGGFTPVSPFTARALSATPNNELFGSWDAFGTFEYVNGVFNRVSPLAADRLAAVRHGFVYGAWPVFGTFQFKDGVFTQVSAFEADQLTAAEDGTFFGSWRAFGTFQWTPTAGFRQVSFVAATALAAHADPTTGAVSLAGAFPPFGTFRYDAATAQFTPISPFAAGALSYEDTDDVVGAFFPFGTFDFRFSTRTFTTLTTETAALIAAG